MKPVTITPRFAERILELASRAGGVSASEAQHVLDCDRNTARKRMRNMEVSGALVSQSGGYNGRHLRWFSDRAAARAWAETQKRFAPSMAMPKPAPVPTRGIASGCDTRYQLSEAEREALRGVGVFSRLRVGEYPE